jgi:hypothetical protein
VPLLVVFEDSIILIHLALIIYTLHYCVFILVLFCAIGLIFSSKQNAKGIGSNVGVW